MPKRIALFLHTHSWLVSRPALLIDASISLFRCLPSPAWIIHSQLCNSQNPMSLNRADHLWIVHILAATHLLSYCPFLVRILPHHRISPPALQVWLLEIASSLTCSLAGWLDGWLASRLPMRPTPSLEVVISQESRFLRVPLWISRGSCHSESRDSWNRMCITSPSSSSNYYQ